MPRHTPSPLHSRVRRALVVLATAGLTAARVDAADPGNAPAARIQQTPQLQVLGCPVTVDLTKTHDCISKAVQREVVAAERRGRAFVQAQLEAARSELEKLEAQLEATAKELERARRNAEREIAIAVARERARTTAAADTINTSLANAEWYREATRILQAQAPLFTCLQQDRRFDFAAAANAFTKAPGQFVHSQLRMSISALRTEWPVLMKAELDQLARGQVATRTPAAVVGAASEKLVRVAEDVPGARCVVAHVNPMVQAQLEATIREIAPLIEKELRAVLVEQIIPELLKGIQKQLREVFGRITARQGTSASPPLSLETEFPFLKGLTLTEDELKGIVRRVLLERRFERLRPLLSAVDEVDRTTGSPRATPAQLASARQKVFDAIEVTDDWDQLYLAIGVEALRASGHKYLDSDEPGHGGFLLNHGVSLLQFSEGTIEKVAVALCGLIPEVGAAACAVVEEAINLAWNQGAVPLLEAVASGILHDTWNDAMTRVRQEVEKGQTLEQIKARAGLGPVDALIATLPHETLLGWATGVVAADKAHLDQLFEAIGTLATAATRR